MRPDSVRPAADKLQLWHLLVMTVGVAVGLALYVNRESPSPAAFALGVFGGIALAGPPILLWTRRRSKRKWGAGRVLWFMQGTSAWLLWPPLVVLKSQGAGNMVGGPSTGICFAYGTPLMALFVFISLVAGRWIRPRRRRRRRPLLWSEVMGLVLGLGWACTGLYLLASFWQEDLRAR